MPSTELLSDLQTRAVPAIVDRRSVLLLLEDLWYRDRKCYWKYLLEMMTLGKPGLSRIVFAQSVARLASEDEDLFPLLESIRNAATKGIALHGLRFLCNYVSADPHGVHPLPWLRMCDQIALDDEDDTITRCATILQRLWNGHPELEPSLRALAAKAARHLWSVSMQRNLIALKAVIDTFSEDIEASEAVLNPLFEPDIANPSRELALQELTQEIRALLGAPELVSRLYERAIRAEADAEAKQKQEIRRWSEKSERAEHEGDLPSSPRSGTAMGLDAEFWLEQYISQFLKVAPKRAARCIAESALYWERATDVFRADDVQRVPLVVDGHAFVIEGREAERHEYSSRLVDKLIAALLEHLLHCDEETREAILIVLIDVPAPATVWASVIETSAHDEWLREKISTLVLDVEAIRLFMPSVVHFLTAAVSEIPVSWLEQIKKNVETLDDRDRYAKLEIERALRVARTRNERIKAPRDSKPTSSSADVDDYVVALDQVDIEMRQLNVSKADLEDPVNASIWQAKKVAEEVADRFAHHGTPGTIEVVDIQTAAQALRQLARALEALGAHAGIVTSGWCALARLASLVQVTDVSSDPAFLIAAARRMDGLPWLQLDRFNNLLNARQAFPRAEAVRGLLVLISSTNANNSTISLIEQLVKDPEPAVRFQIAYNLPMLVTVDHERLWPIVERLLQDSSIAVAAAALHNLGPFYGIDRDRTLALCISVLDRFANIIDETPFSARADALIQVCWYHLTQSHLLANEAIDKIVDDIPKTVNGLGAVLHNFRSWLTMDSGDDIAQENARRRTIELYIRLGNAAVSALRAGNRERDVNATQRTERDPCAILLEDLAKQLYFATGAFQEKQGASRLPLFVIARLYADICEFLSVLGTAGSVATGNTVLETLEYFFRVARESSSISSADVLERFVLVARSLIGANAVGSYWKLDAIERVLRRCIAERDPSLSNEDVLLAWGSILDPLLEQGWKQAFLLARDLDVSS